MPDPTPLEVEINGLMAQQRLSIDRSTIALGTDSFDSRKGHPLLTGLRAISGWTAVLNGTSQPVRLPMTFSHHLQATQPDHRDAATQLRAALASSAAAGMAGSAAGAGTAATPSAGMPTASSSSSSSSAQAATAPRAPGAYIPPALRKAQAPTTSASSSSSAAAASPSESSAAAAASSGSSTSATAATAVLAEADSMWLKNKQWLTSALQGSCPVDVCITPGEAPTRCLLFHQGVGREYRQIGKDAFLAKYQAGDSYTRREVCLILQSGYVEVKEASIGSGASQIRYHVFTKPADAAAAASSSSAASSGDKPGWRREAAADRTDKPWRK